VDCGFLYIFLSGSLTVKFPAGSVKATADELFLHRNTVNYKIGKAREVLYMDLSTLDSRLQLSIGFMLYDMLT